MTLPTKFYHVIQITLQVCSCDQNLVTVASQPQFYKDLTRKTTFLRGDLASNSMFGTGTRYKIEILHQCGKKVKTKSQKDFWAKSYICGSYRGKTSSGVFLPPLLPPHLKGYLRYKTITSQKVPSEAQVKDFSFHYVPFSRYSSVWIFNHPMIYQICDVIMSIST